MSFRLAGLSVTVDGGEVNAAPLCVFVPVKPNWHEAERTTRRPSEPATCTVVSVTGPSGAQVPVAVGEASFG
ncbi:hypothetical protein D3C83_239700 [compost metagenome]